MWLILLLAAVYGYQVDYTVTGGAGFIGSHLVHALREKYPDRSIRIVDNFSRGKRRNLDGLTNISFLEGDLRNISVAREATAGTRVVFHLADIVASAKYLENNGDQVFRDNLLIDTNVLQACLDNKVEKYIYAGSSAGYPIRSGFSIFSEEDAFPAQAESPYGWSKLIGELSTTFIKVVDKKGLKTSVLRLPNIYGPKSDDTSDLGLVIPSLFRKALRSPEVKYEVWGDGLTYRDFLYVDDAVRGFLLLETDSTAIGKILQVGTGHPTSIGQIATMIARLTKIKLRKDITPIFSSPITGQIQGRVSSSDKIKELGWSSQVSLWEGLSRSLDWYLQDKGETGAEANIINYSPGVPPLPKPRVLVIMIGNLRGGKMAWESCYRHLLVPLEADLMLVMGETPHLRSSFFYQKAKYRLIEKEHEDWGVVLDEIANGTDWEVLCSLRPQWLGKVKKCNHPASAGATWSLRWRAYQYLKTGLLYEYDQFIVTRSDFLYVEDHPRLSLDYIWTPKGQEWGGLNDRHLVASQLTILPALGILDDLVHHPNEWVSKFLPRTPTHGWGSENILAEYLRDGGWIYLTRSYVHPAFLISERGVDKTGWVAPGEYSTELPYPGVLLKYPSEFQLAKTVATNWQVDLGITWKQVSRKDET